MEMDAGMRREILQRFLDLEAQRGTDELEAWRALGFLLGISYPAKEGGAKPKRDAAQNGRG